MKPAEIAKIRLLSQSIFTTTLKTPRDVVHNLGAMQAQDYPGALWGVGLRTKDAKLGDVEQAIMDREIVRTWPMRGTLHFVAGEDIVWMIDLLAQKAIRQAASRRRNLGLEDTELNKAKDVLIKALSGKDLYKSRADLVAELESHKIKTAGQRGIHILAHHAQAGLLCFGPHIGKQPSFALMERWVPKAPQKTADEAWHELAVRYFTSHGPASLRDFAWWNGQNLTDCKRAIELAKDELETIESNGTTYWLARNFKTPTGNTGLQLLPGFDEFVLGYTDRSIILHADHSPKVVPGNNGMFLSSIVDDGQIVGLWKKTPRSKEIQITIEPFTEFSRNQIKALEAPLKRYGDFIGTSTRLINQSNL